MQAALFAVQTFQANYTLLESYVAGGTLIFSDTLEVTLFFFFCLFFPVAFLTQPFSKDAFSS